MNCINIIGRLTADPETHQMATNSVCNIRIAVNGRKKDGDNWVDDPMFINAKAWDKQAEFISKHFEKGKEIWIQGELKIEQWEKDGQKRSAPVIRVRTCGFTSGKSNGNGKDDGDDFV